MCLFYHVPWPTVGRVLTASLPVVIAGIVAYIAWQQFAVNRARYRLALFEKRLAVFNATMKMIFSVVEKDDPGITQGIQFLRDTRAYAFLFEPEVGNYIHEVFSKARELAEHVKAGPSGEREYMLLYKWFVQQSTEAAKLFLKYMDFRKP